MKKFVFNFNSKDSKKLNDFEKIIFLKRPKPVSFCVFENPEYIFDFRINMFDFLVDLCENRENFSSIFLRNQ